MYFQRFPYYNQDMNQMQVPPCMRGNEEIERNSAEMELEAMMPEYKLETRQLSFCGRGLLREVLYKIYGIKLPLGYF